MELLRRLREERGLTISLLSVVERSVDAVMVSYDGAGIERCDLWTEFMLSVMIGVVVGRQFGCTQ